MSRHTVPSPDLSSFFNCVFAVGAKPAARVAESPGERRESCRAVMACLMEEAIGAMAGSLPLHVIGEGLTLAFGSQPLVDFKGPVLGLFGAFGCEVSAGSF